MPGAFSVTVRQWSRDSFNYGRPSLFCWSHGQYTSPMSLCVFPTLHVYIQLLWDRSRLWSQRLKGDCEIDRVGGDTSLRKSLQISLWETSVIYSWLKSSWNIPILLLSFICFLKCRNMCCRLCHGCLHILHIFIWWRKGARGISAHVLAFKRKPQTHRKQYEIK